MTFANLLPIRRHRTLLVVAMLVWVTLAQGLTSNAALADSIEGNELIYTMRPGDNLWTLCGTYLKHRDYYREIQRINRIDAPTRLPVGSRVRIPLNWLKRTPEAAQISQTQGEVEIIHVGDQHAVAAKLGDKLETGDTIRTGKSGNATLTMADGSKLAVLPESLLIMDTLSSFGINGMVDSRLRLQRGRVDAQVPHRKTSPSNYEITTPAAITAVRGTNFRVDADASKPAVVSRTEVLRGSVAVSASSESQSVDMGFGTLTEQGKPPLPPRELLPAPQFDASGAIRIWPAMLNWNAVTGAKAYRVQISPADSFEELTLNTVTSSAQVTLPELADGNYALRIRSIDELGLEGLNGDSTLTVDAQPAPPVSTSSETDQTLTEPRPAFSWQAAETAAQYRFQLSQNPDFDPILTNQTVVGTGFTPNQPLAPGTYYWCLSSIDAQGAEGPTGPAQRFTIKIVPTIVELKSDAMIKGGAFVWQGHSAATQYHYQLSDDEQFVHIVAEGETAENSIGFPELLAGSYWLRVQAIDADGQAGPYSEPTKAVVPSGFLWPAAGVAALLLLL